MRLRCHRLGLLATGSPAATVAAARGQFTLPNRPGSGYRIQPPVPDRLKDALSNFGADTRNIFPDDQDPAFVPEEGRKKMVSELISSTAHLRNHSKLDRLRAALDKVHDCPSVFHDDWKEVYLFLRTTEMCCEVRKVDADVFPKGQKLWIDLSECKERRVPSLLELPNGIRVLPIFSMEEYLDHYFSLVDAFESCWFPVPRMGSRWDLFCGMEFPVAATGTLRYHSTLATLAGGEAPVGILVNPGQRTSKFITYPEMVQLTEIMNRRVRDRVLDLSVKQPTGEWKTIFSPGLITTFDTRKMPMKRVSVTEPTKRQSILPPIAQLELHLLLFQYKEIASVYIRTVERASWKRALGGSQYVTHIDVVPFSPSQKPPVTFVETLKEWSYLKEFSADININLIHAAPTDEKACCVYNQQDGELLRSMETFKGMTLADTLEFNEPLVDENNTKPYGS